MQILTRAARPDISVKYSELRNVFGMRDEVFPGMIDKEYNIKLEGILSHIPFCSSNGAKEESGIYMLFSNS